MATDVMPKPAIKSPGLNAGKMTTAATKTPRIDNHERSEPPEQIGERYVEPRPLSGGVNDAADDSGDNHENAENDNAENDIRQLREKPLPKSRIVCQMIPDQIARRGLKLSGSVFAVT